MNADAEDKPRGLCHPDDLGVFQQSHPEYDWATDRFCPPDFSYDQDSGRLIARIARDTEPAPPQSDVPPPEPGHMGAHPLDGSSRFSLLGMLAELNGLVVYSFRGTFDDSVMDERERLAGDDRERANEMFGERVVDAMFGDGPVRVTVSSGGDGAVTK